MTDRKILFKGFHPDENGKTTITLNGEKIKGEWVYGSYIEHERAIEWCSFVSPDGLTVYSDCAEVIPETVGQFVTTDKNGKYAFEGDKVRLVGDDEMGEVVYMPLECRWLIEFNGEWLTMDDSDFEVIRNKWESEVAE